MNAASHTAAFADQLARLGSRLDAGMPRLGWKVGINVPEVQARLGLGHALVGWLDGDRAHASGAQVPVPAGARLHVEPELCLRIARPVAADASREDAGGAIDAVAPALELVDYALPVGGLDDLIRNCMFHHAWVLGDWQPWRASQRLAIADGVRLRVGEQDADPARDDLVPANAGDLVLQVAARLAEGGAQLQPGDHILSGSFTARALPLAAGETARAELGAFGAVTCAAKPAD